MSIKSLMAIAAVASIVSGCATIMTGATQAVSIDSDPQGATVLIGKEKVVDGKKEMVESRVLGLTPVTADLPRSGVMLQVSKEGHQTVDVPLQTGMNPWVWGDILLTSPLSTSIDTSTGAANEYNPGQYMVTLPPN